MYTVTVLHIQLDSIDVILTLPAVLTFLHIIIACRLLARPKSLLHTLVKTVK